jgi:eukaryotic-like serine/threonine-protein kinase
MTDTAGDGRNEGVNVEASGDAGVGSIADYVLVRRLERAINGDFFLARTPDRLGLDAEYVMVKVLDSGTPADTLRRATREIRAFAAVESPHLVALLDAGQDGHRLFYTMDYLPLGSLARPQIDLDTPRIVRAMTSAARAAHALHENGIAHRDIQPANVLLTDDGGKLADLGLAQVFSPDYAVTGFGNIGAVEYMDPSVVQGSTATRASDIWALGTTLHRAMAGVGVYGEVADDEPLATIRKVLSSDPQLAEALPERIRDVVERCLQPDPADRYATAAEFAAELELI